MNLSEEKTSIVWISR